MEIQFNQVFNLINQSELKELALTMGNIFSPTGNEQKMTEFIYTWMKENGFEPKKIGLLAEHDNVLGRLRGKGGGSSLIFNSHMDTAIGEGEFLRLRNPNEEVYLKAWLEGDTIVGNGVMNDKGPLAAWLIAIKAIKESGIELLGDILLSAVVGEIGNEPVDEFQGHEYSGKDLGTRYLITHGGVADYALNAEASSFVPAWVEAGKAFFKITVFAGPSRYTPYIKRPCKLIESENAIVRAAVLIEALEEWALKYEQVQRYECSGGIVIPKVNIGAIRSGKPYQLTRTPEVCYLYVDVRLTPGQNPVRVQAELEQVLKNSQLEGEVDLFMYRPGHEARNIEPLLESTRLAHREVFGEDFVLPAATTITSMWRDINPFNEVGIPSLTYGPGGGSGGGGNRLTLEELTNSAKVYAAIALDICSKPVLR